MELDIFDIELLRIIKQYSLEGGRGIGFEQLDRELFDKMGFEETLNKGIMISERIQKLRENELIEKDRPYKITNKGRNVIDNDNNLS